jgi:hypothetical protein
VSTTNIAVEQWRSAAQRRTRGSNTSIALTTVALAGFGAGVV